MGSSQSTLNVTNQSTQTYVTENDVNIVNQNVNNAVANALISNGATCKAINTITQGMSFRGCKVGGDIKVSNVNQNAVITVDFSCLNAFKAEQGMAQALLSELVNDLQNKMTTKALNEMGNAAETQASTTGILGGSANANTNANNTFNLSVVNKNNTAIQNVIANSVQSNFNVKNIQECIHQAEINQSVDFSNCQTGGSLIVSELAQNAGIKSVVNCVNNSGTVQSVLSEVANKLNIAVKSETESDVTSTMKNAVTTSATSTGITGLGSCDMTTLIVCAVLCVIILIVLSVGVCIFKQFSPI